MRRLLSAPLDAPHTGLLLGHVSEDDVLMVEEAVFVPWSDRNGDSPEEALRLAREVAGAEIEPGDGIGIAGWYFVGPGSGGLAGPEALPLHRELFPEWWQVAVILDPASRGHGVYGWRSGKFARLGGRAPSDGSKVDPGAGWGRGRGAASSAPRHPSGEAVGSRGLAAQAGTKWEVRTALGLPVVAGIIGGVVLAIVK